MGSRGARLEERKKERKEKGELRPTHSLLFFLFFFNFFFSPAVLSYGGLPSQDTLSSSVAVAAAVVAVFYRLREQASTE